MLVLLNPRPFIVNKTPPYFNILNNFYNFKCYDEWENFYTKNLPPVPLEMGLNDEATKENVNVVTSEVIWASPLFWTLILNEYVPTGFSPKNIKFNIKF